MRCIVENSIDAEVYNLEHDFVLDDKDKLHHLLNVIRLEKEEKILVINGRGGMLKGTVTEITKRQLVIKFKDKIQVKDNRRFDLVLGITKRDAFEESIKYAVELGVKNIFPLQSQYSQKNFPKDDRLSRLVESAMIQSNNPFELEINETIVMPQIKEMAMNYDEIYYFSSVMKSGEKSLTSKNKKILVIIGPEGGFSNNEEHYLSEISGIRVIRFPTFILRAQTAVPAAIGHLL